MLAFPELIQALLSPQAYPDPPARVELIQTQISCIFFAGDLVYKVKKPVDMGFLDYSTLEKRLTLCQKEVELNRRLCPQAYLGVTAITRQKGAYKVGGRGRPLEYAVKMRRLPGEAMMDFLLERDGVTIEMIGRVAAKLADFHARAASGEEINRLGGLEAVIKNTEENFEQTEKYFDVIIAPEAFYRLRDFTRGFIERNRPLFLRRVQTGRIRDCHGDLHAAHVCFCADICIYDCIEFIDRLRYTDITADVAFLAMDLDHYGRRDLSAAFVKKYVAASGDGELLELLDFYKCYRAYVRGKVGCFQYDDPYISAGEKVKIVAAARSYFELAVSYTSSSASRPEAGRP
jgi:aminoglycoside phosphotransferase family enzyme